MLRPFIVKVSVLRCLHTKKVAGLSGGYFITDIRENDFSRILLIFGVKTKISAILSAGLSAGFNWNSF